MAMRTSAHYKVLIHLRQFPSHTPIVIYDSLASEGQSDPFAVTELLDFHVELRTKEEGVRISLDLGEDVGTVALSSESPYAKVYEYGDNYPWRCGVFQFAVHDSVGVHSGLLEIVPKNVSQEQFQLIHKVVNERVNGLVYDFFHVRQVGTMFSPDLEQYTPWQFFAWYRTVEQDLIEAIQQIEQHPETDMKVDYQVESRQKAQNRKTLMWQMMHPLAAINNRFLNRTVQETIDCLPNQLVKSCVHEILSQLQSNMEQLTEIYHQFELELEQDNQTNMRRRLSVLNRFTEDYEKIFHTLNDLINREFWRSVSKVNSIRTQIMRRNSYQTVFQIWEQALLTYENRAGNNLSYAPTLRTSDQIYEYYVYFSLIEVFEQLGYCIDDQMTQFSYLGLSDGTSVYLRDENGAVMLTFNEEIELNHFNAMRNGGGFYTFEMKRKPDIRIDLYSLDGEYSKVSSIFEVKYRPLNSIYSARDIREAETQMSKYWAIGYVDSAGQFTPRVVRSVNCVYPGDERAEPVIHGPQGDFVQFYPISQSEEYGRENLTGIIQNWLNQHQK